MVTLHVTIYNLGDGDGDQFKVFSQQGDNPEELTEVTDQYVVAAIQTPNGRTGFAVLQREPEEVT